MLGLDLEEELAGNVRVDVLNGRIGQAQIGDVLGTVARHREHFAQLDVEQDLRQFVVRAND